MAAVVFLPFPKAKSNGRTIFFLGAALSLIPIIAKMTFSIFPLLEARLMPVDLYTVIQREFWLPFAILFFAECKTMKKKALQLGLALLSLLFINQLSYADGVYIPAAKKKMPDIPVQRALVKYQGGIEALIVESTLNGEGHVFPI